MMAGLIIIGTVFALTRPHDAPPILRFGKPEAAGKPAETYNDDVSIFSGIGRLRIPLANSSTLILSIAFPYSSNDSAFMEELAVRINDFRSIAIEYFSTLPADKLINLDEDAAKTEILKRYNAVLRLGKIEALYFSDLLIV
jgi:flagellar basal body-associated protein FliL